MESLGTTLARAQLTRITLPDHAFCTECGYIVMHVPEVRSLVRDRIPPHRWVDVVPCTCEPDRKAAGMQRWALANLPHDREPKDFGNFEVRPGTEQAVIAAQRFAAGDGPRILTLLGEHGTGKSHLAEAICRALLGQGLSVRYERVTELADRLLEAVSRRDSQSQVVADIIGRCRDARVVVLDDLGLEVSSDFIASELTSLVEQRTRWGRMVVTTNQGPETLAAKHGGAYARIASRVYAAHSGEAVVAMLLPETDWRTGRPLAR